MPIVPRGRPICCHCGDDERRALVASCDLAARKAAHDALRVYRARRSLGLDDFISAAHYGLVRASLGYNPTLGFTFLTYANYWMKRTIRECVAQSDTINLHRYMERAGRSRNPHNLERASACSRVLPQHDRDGRDILEVVSAPEPEPDPSTVEFSTEMRDSLRSLNARELRIVTEYHIDGKTLNEVSLMIGVSRERVRQIAAKCRTKLAARLRARGVKP